MPTVDEILLSLQYSSFYSSDPLNSAGSPAYEITYQFAASTAPDDLPTSSTYTGWRPFTAAEKTAFKAALDHIETVLNVSFTEVTGEDDPDVNIGAVDFPGSTAGTGGYSITSSFAGDIVSWDGYAVFDNSFDLSLDIYMHLFLHEMGHAMGLRHTFGAAESLGAPYDSNKYSVMSYTENPDNGLDSDALMLHDVLALQDIWGSVGYNGGKTKYSGSRTDTIDLIWDTGGKDQLHAGSRSSDVTLDLRAGKFSTFDTMDDVVIAYGVKIENAVGGSGDDTLQGNGSANKLTGKAGDDMLKGAGGKDKLIGGSGDDTLKGGGGKDVLQGQKGSDVLFGNGGADKFVFKAGHGSDTIRDFQDGIDTIKVSGLGSKTAVLADAAEIGSDVVFDFGGGDMLTVRGTTIAELTDDLIA